MQGSTGYAGLVSMLYEHDFPPAQGAWVEGFVSLLVELRRVFGNDLDKVMILSAIGQQMLRDPAMPPLPHAEAQKGSIRDWTGRTTNIDALARATGIPRESVRRKVNELQEDGLVERNAARGLVVSPGASGRLSRSTEVSIAMLDQVFATYMRMLVEQDAIRLDRVVPAPRPPAYEQ